MENIYIQGIHKEWEAYLTLLVLSVLDAAVEAAQDSETFCNAD